MGEFVIYDTYYDNTEDIDPYEFYDCYGFFPNDNDPMTWQVLADNNALWRESEEDSLGRIEVSGDIYAVRRKSNGCVSCARISSLGDIFNDVIQGDYDSMWYVKDGELLQELHHHDGTVYTRYRLVPDEAVLFNLMRSESVTWEEIWNRGSLSLGQTVCKAYGLD